MRNIAKITDLEKENGLISNISLNLDKQSFANQFQVLMEFGWIKATSFSLPETFVGDLSDSVYSLIGQKAEVFSDGTKIGEGTFDQDTTVLNSNEINLGFDFNEDLIQEEGIPRVEDLPSGINSGDEFAEAFDIRDLSFKVVKEAKEKVKNTSPSEGAEAAKESQDNNNFEMPEKPPGGWPPMMNSTSPGGLNNKDARDTLGKAGEAAKDKVKNTSPSEAAEAANKYKGIIQLGVLAVGIAGTVGAYVWGKN